MLTQLELSVRPVTREDRQKLANLIHFEAYVHRHLDWRPPLDWVGFQPYLLAEQKGLVQAALACPPDPPSVAWIRLFAAASSVSLERSWDVLWSETRERLAKDNKLEWVAAIPLHTWFQTLLEESSFNQTHLVVMLSWERGARLPSENIQHDILIRSMNLDDLAAVHEVDAGSFVPVWQNSQDLLELAYRQASFATVAEHQGKLVGYQISTATPMGGHLARLAVLPEVQGQGVGYALVRDTLSQYERRGAQIVTVNTQQDNLASLALYKKAGFHPTGEQYPVYQYNPH